MKKLVASAILAAAFALGGPLVARSAGGAAPSSSQVVLAQWNEIGRKLIAMAEDFPEDKYEFKPVAAERSFAEQLLRGLGAGRAQRARRARKARCARFGRAHYAART